MNFWVALKVVCSEYAISRTSALNSGVTAAASKRFHGRSLHLPADAFGDVEQGGENFSGHIGLHVVACVPRTRGVMACVGQMTAAASHATAPRRR